MISNTLRYFIILIVNVTIFIVAIGIIEIYFRYDDSPKKKFTNAIFAQVPFPYMMFVNGGPIKKESPIVWRDIFRKKNINATHRRNNIGFRTDEDFDFVKVHKKKDNERIVLVTGGSAVHGVGATSNETLLSAVMEEILNSKQDRFTYRVINMGMGAWISYQQYLALGMWGKWYDPDWMVVMDGWNDIAVACAHSQGAFFPNYYHAMRSYIDGYLTQQIKPSFYRGRFENWLVKKSAAYRSISGKKYVPRKQHIVTHGGISRIVKHTTWKDVERQVTFYLHSQELVMNLSDNAKYILSIQPIAKENSQVFVGEKTLNKIHRQLKGKECGIGTFQIGGLAYFMTNIDHGLKELVARYSDRHHVQYLNMNHFFPLEYYKKLDYLIDLMHLNDLGHRVVAEVYAAHILTKDLGEPERFLSEMKVSLEKLIGQPLPTSQQLAATQSKPYRFSPSPP